MAVPKIVFVDDDPDDRELLADCMLQNGIHDFIILESGRILFAYLELSKMDELPELIVVDLNMPVMTGYEVVQKLAADEKYQMIPVIIFTTSDKTPMVEKAMLPVAKAYYKKPNSLSAMTRVLQEIYSHIKKPF